MHSLALRRLLRPRPPRRHVLGVACNTIDATHPRRDDAHNNNENQLGGRVAQRPRPPPGRQPRLIVTPDDKLAKRWSPSARLLFIFGVGLGLWLLIGLVVFAVIMVLR